MRRISRVTLSLALSMAPLVGAGCASLAPQHISARGGTRAELKMNTARLEESRGHLAEAKKLYVEVHQLFPQNGECSYQLARICTLQNQHSEAAGYYELAYGTHGNNPDFLADMGYSAYLRKDYVQSENLLEQSVRLNPQNQRTVTNLAIAQAWLKKDELSFSTFRSVSSEADSLRSLAAIQVARGDRDYGQKNYELAQGINSNQPANATDIGFASARFAATSAGDTPSVAQETASSQPLATGAVIAAVTTPLPLAASSGLQPVPGQVSVSVARTELSNAPLPASDGTYPVSTVVSDVYDPTVVSISSAFTTGTTDSRATAAFEAGRSIPEKTAQSEPDRLQPLTEESTESMVFELPIKEIPGDNSQTRSSWRKTIHPAEPTEREIVLTSSDSHGSAPKAALEADVDLSDMKNVCLVALSEERRIVRALPEFAVEHQSQQYQFSSAEALQKFRTEPKRYLPAVGGLDIVSFRNEQGIVAGSLKFAIWYRSRLYVFSSKDNAEAFRKFPQKFAGDD